MFIALGLIVLFVISMPFVAWWYHNHMEAEKERLRRIAPHMEDIDLDKPWRDRGGDASNTINFM